MSMRSNVDARRFDARVVIQRPTNVVNPVSGARTKGWAEVATVWASVNARPAREQYVAAQVADAPEYIVEVRWRGDLTSAMRLLWGERVLEILDVPDNGKRGRTLFLPCRTGLSDG